MRILTTIDDYLVGAANQVVRASNYMFGIPRSTLATTLNTVSAATYLYSKMLNHEYFTAAITAPFIAMGDLLSTLEYKSIDNLEASAQSSNLKDPEVEKFKQREKIWGTIFGTLTVGFAVTAPFMQAEPLPPWKISPRTLNYMATGLFYCMAMASYVMRADYVAPRPNLFRRVADSVQKSNAPQATASPS